MNTRFVEAFIWVARLGSFRAAADRLFLTQAAISHRIAALEQELGGRVFERKPRGLRLTPLGRRLLPYGERLLELEAEIMQLDQPGAPLLGLVRIGVIESVAHTWLVRFLQRLQSKHPGIEVQLSSETTEKLRHSLRAAEIDIALQSDAALGDGIVSRPCLPLAMGWVGPPGQARPEEASLEQLLRTPIITMSRGSQPYLAVKDLYRKARLSPGKLHCVSSIAALARLVQAGFGYALLPLAPVRDKIERGDLRWIPCAQPLPAQQLVVSHLERDASEAINLVAELACRESDGFVRALPAPYAPPTELALIDEPSSADKKS